MKTTYETHQPQGSVRTDNSNEGLRTIVGLLTKHLISFLNFAAWYLRHLSTSLHRFHISLQLECKKM